MGSSRLEFTPIMFKCLYCGGTVFIDDVHVGEILYHYGIPYLCPNDGRHMCEDRIPDLISNVWIEAIPVRLSESRPWRRSSK